LAIWAWVTLSAFVVPTSDLTMRFHDVAIEGNGPRLPFRFDVFGHDPISREITGIHYTSDPFNSGECRVLTL
jgi:hypothetical protein